MTCQDIIDPADLWPASRMLRPPDERRIPAFRAGEACTCARTDRLPGSACPSRSSATRRAGPPTPSRWSRTSRERKRLDAELRQASDRLVLAPARLECRRLGQRDAGRRLPARPGATTLNVWEQLGYEGSPAYRRLALNAVHPDDRVLVEDAASRYLAGETTEFETEALRATRIAPTAPCSRGASRCATPPASRSASWASSLTSPSSSSPRRRTPERGAVPRHLRERRRRYRPHRRREPLPALNQKMCEILGYPGEELVGKTVPEVTHPDDLAPNLLLFGALMRGELPTFAMEKRFFHKDGSLVSTYLTVSLQRDEAGEPAYAIVMVQDITERKRLKRRAPAGQGGGGGGQPGQGRVPGQRQPRDPHADERHPRHDRAGPRHARWPTSSGNT